VEDLYVVLGAFRYDFADDKTGRQVAGVKLTVVSGEPRSESNRMGYEPMTISAPAALWQDLGHVPGVYNFSFGMRAGTGGKIQPVLKSIKYVGEIDIFLAATSAV
jgi:hypothetical protein